ncbi:MAG: AAA family ATPase [Candidatus Thorarchaeota archaeon]
MGTMIPRLRDYEAQLLTEYQEIVQKRKIPIIAIGGFSGTGKDTVAIFIKRYFKFKHQINLTITGAGTFIRKIAVESGWREENLDEFMSHIKNSQDEKFAEEVDLKIERHALRMALLEGGIFVGRMAPFAIGTHGTTIWLEVTAPVIAARITRDPNRAEYGMQEKELIRRIRLRDSTDGDRLERIYGISFRDRYNFDLTLRNEGMTIAKLEERIKDLLDKKYGDFNR